jgi:plasmid stability protein
MKHLTVRNLPPPIAKALEKERRRRGKSLNKTVIELLGQGLAVALPHGRNNGLRRLAGTWSEAELKRFSKTIEAAEVIDEDLWR